MSMLHKQIACLPFLGFRVSDYGAAGRTFVRKGLRGESTLTLMDDGTWSVALQPYDYCDDGAKFDGLTLDEALHNDQRAPW